MQIDSSGGASPKSPQSSVGSPLIKSYDYEDGIKREEINKNVFEKKKLKDSQDFIIT